MKEYLKQHFVPQFYLKRFGELLYCYDKLKDNIFSNSPKNIGHEHLFYDTKTSAGKIEGILKDLDDRFARAYSYVLERKSVNDIPDDIKFDFFLFLSCQMNRTRTERNEIKYIFAKTLHKLDPLGEFYSLTDDDLKIDHASIMFKTLVPFAKILSTKLWVISENKTPLPLWTSDNPLILTNSLDFGAYVGNIGLLVKGIEIHFPLSNTLELLSFDQSTHRLRSKNNYMISDNVKWSNMLQTKYSSRFIYSKDNNFELAKRFLKEYPMFKNTLPRGQIY